MNIMINQYEYIFALQTSSAVLFLDKIHNIEHIKAYFYHFFSVKAFLDGSDPCLLVPETNLIHIKEYAYVFLVILK